MERKSNAEGSDTTRRSFRGDLSAKHHHLLRSLAADLDMPYRAVVELGLEAPEARLRASETVA